MNDNFQTSALRRPRRLYLPRETRRLGKALLTQQCWCWGQDIRRPEGNLLLEYGFERQRPPAGENGATTYTLRLLPNRFLALWGFGLWFGECGRGAVFVGRFDFEPRFSACAEPPLPVWTPGQLSELSVPASTRERRLTRTLLVEALGCAAAYEKWALGKTGLDYRRRCLEAWAQKNSLPPEQVAPAWERVAQSVLSSRRAVACNG